MALLATESPNLLLLIDEFAIMIAFVARRDRNEAEQLLRWFRGARLAPDTKTRFVIGVPIPYLLAVFLTAIFDRHRASGASVTVAMVKAAFEDGLLGGATSAVFQHYRSRIDQYYPGQEGQAARAILGTLSRAEQTVQKNTLYQLYLKKCNLPPTQKAHDDFMQLMYKLDNDFYIETQEDTYTFFSRVLQLWWKTHYGFQGV